MYAGRAKPFILASGSPRRRELLKSAGLAFEIITADIDETPLTDEQPVPYVERVADAKADAVRARVADESRVVLAADTTVVHDGGIIGKPQDRADAKRILKRLANDTHRVITAVSVHPAAGSPVTAIVTTHVYFAALSDPALECYLDHAEWADKAGAYAIQDAAAGMVTRIEGSYSNVVGLPLAETLEMLRQVDVIQD